MKFAGAVVCLLVSVGTAGPAAAADPFYIGNWTVAAAVVAPWADPQRKPDGTERARLIGRAVVLKAGRSRDLGLLPAPDRSTR